MHWYTESTATGITDSSAAQAQQTTVPTGTTDSKAQRSCTDLKTAVLQRYSTCTADSSTVHV